jgi:putative FmdB family regulatory protein
MPIFGYKCQVGHEHDVLEKYEDDEIKVCPQCGLPAERQLSAPNFNMKQGPYDSYL